MSENQENRENLSEETAEAETFDVPNDDVKDEFIDIKSASVGAAGAATASNEFEDVGFNVSFNETLEDILSSSSKTDENQQYEDISSSSKKKTKKGGKKKKLSVAKKVLLISGVSLLSLILAIAIFATYIVEVRYNYHHDKEFAVPVEQIDENIINIALFGVDTRTKTDFTGNTDSIMILSINKKTNKIKIVSIMRDTFVPIQNSENQFNKYGKINAAYASGGSNVTKSAQSAVNTLNTVYGLDIANYAVINFSGMAKIIDAVGGITATITEDELAWKGSDHPNLNGCMQEICREENLNENDYYIKKAGEQQLNGVQAVAYARVRHCRSVWGTNNDYGRTDRQRYVMQQLFNKATKLSLGQMDSLIRSLIPISQTSLGAGDILELAKVLLKSPTFEQYRLPQEMEISVQQYSPMYNRYGWILYYDINYAKKLMKSVIFEDMTMDEAVKAHPIEKNKWYTGSDSGTLATQDSIPPDVDEVPPADDTDQPDDGYTPPQTDNEPTESEPTESEPTESEPTESEPTESEPTESEPTESEPTESEPTESEPTESEPTESEPTEIEPTESEPTESDPQESPMVPTL